MTVIWGAILSVVSAATFGFNNAAVRRGVLEGSPLQALAISVPLGTPLFLGAAWIMGELGKLSTLGPRVVLALGAAGVLHFAIGRYANYRATQAMGSNLAGAVQELSVVLSLLLAIGFLGERLSAMRLAGIVLILLASFIVRGRPERMATPTFTPNIAEGYAFSLLTAAAYGTSPVLVRASLSAANLPMAGGLISYIAATLAVAAFAVSSRSLAHVREARRAPAQWFALAGVFVGISQLFRYAALSLAPVTVVSPIQRLSLLFRILFGRVLNREHEAWSARLLLSVALALLGSVAVALG